MDDLFGSNEQADPQSDFLARERAALGSDASSFAAPADSAQHDKDYEASAAAFPDLDGGDDDALSGFTSSAPAPAAAPTGQVGGQVSVTGDNEFAAFEQEYPEIDLPSDEVRVVDGCASLAPGMPLGADLSSSPSRSSPTRTASTTPRLHLLRQASLHRHRSVSRRRPRQPRRRNRRESPSSSSEPHRPVPRALCSRPRPSSSRDAQYANCAPTTRRSWREKQAEEIAAREEEYARKKEETIAKARNDIDNFYKEYNAKKEKAIAQNKCVALCLAVCPHRLLTDGPPRSQQGGRGEVQGGAHRLACQGHDVGAHLRPCRAAGLAVQDDDQEQAGPDALQGAPPLAPARGRDGAGCGGLLVRRRRGVTRLDGRSPLSPL